MPIDNNTNTAPPAPGSDTGAEQAEEQSPKAVNMAPADGSLYELPPLTDASVENQFREGALAVGLSVPEVSIIAEQLSEVAPEALTEENCDRELGRLWGSPMEVERHMELIVEAFGDTINQYANLLNRTGLGNSPILISMLYQAAQRRLGRY